MVRTAPPSRCADLGFRPIVHQSPICIHWTSSALKSGGNGRLHQYLIFVRSSIMPGPVGSHPKVFRVHSLEAGMWKGSIMREHSEVVSSLRRGEGDDWHLQSFADDLRDVTQQHALFLYRVISCQNPALSFRLRADTSAPRPSPAPLPIETHHLPHTLRRPSRVLSELETLLGLVCMCHAPRDILNTPTCTPRSATVRAACSPLRGIAGLLQGRSLSARAPVFHL